MLIDYASIYRRQPRVRRQTIDDARFRIQYNIVDQ